MRRLALTLVPFVFLACGREPAAPGIAEGPRFNFVNNPDNGNPRFVRLQDVFGILLIDGARGLFSVQAATDRQFGCNATPTFYTFMDAQDILHNPDDPLAGRINELVQGRGVYIAVYEDFAGWEASGFDCADLLARKVAAGAGNVTYTDNDLLVFLRPNTNANAFGFVAQGTLQWLGGGAAHYNGVSKCVWDGEDGTQISRCKDQINLR